MRGLIQGSAAQNQMLPLESDRWASLPTFGGDASEIPANIVRLRKAVGTPTELEAWGAVRDFFYCQNRIRADTAFAIIPHLAPMVAQMKPEGRLQAVIDLGAAERARGGQVVPEDLSPQSYTEAIRQCRTEAIGLLPTVTNPVEFQYLMSAVAYLNGQHSVGDLLFQNTVEGVCKACGAPVYLEAVAEFTKR